MIEIIYNESGKTGSLVIVKPPKNIRQIGSPRGRHKIYVEDYVYTFLHSAAFEGISQKRAAILLGQSEMSQDIRYTFISGAISCDDFVFQKDGIQFDESCWEYIFKEIKQYFDKQEIVGWFLGMTGFPLELTPMVEAAHRKYFTGRDKVLFLSEPAEGEDIFYAYEQGILQKKEGYYIYYEKNLSMQEYMVSSREKVQGRWNGLITGTQSQDNISENLWETEFMKNAKDSEQEQVKGQKFVSGQTSSVIMAEQTDKKSVLGQEVSEIVKEQTLKELKTGQAVLKKDKQRSGIKQKDAKSKTGQVKTKATETKIQKSAIEQEIHDSAAEQAIQNYRSMLLERKDAPTPRKMGMLLYTAASAAMVVLCVIGITTMNNYEKMKQVEQTLAVISQNSSGSKEQGQTQPGKVTVESIPGEVTSEAEQSADKEEGNTGSGKNNDDKAGASTESQTSDDKAGASTESQTTDGRTGNSSGKQTDGDKTGTSEADDGKPGISNTQQTHNGKTDGTTKDARETAEAAALAKSYLEQGYYEVQSGDKLESICLKIYQTTAIMEKLCEVNQIDDVDKIYVGQKLLLP